MFPSLEQIRDECEVSELEERLLCSSQAPIVLLRRRPKTPASASRISLAVAPRNPYLGAMLPSTPLHHLLLRRLGFPVVATSGNLAEEPICIDEREALARLGSVADLFLVHNRPIVRHADDSILRVMAGRELMLRRARGFAPLPVATADTSRGTRPGAQSAPIPARSQRAVLAVGAHLKNSIALAVGRDTFISQHIGDLETAQAYSAFERVLADFQQFYEAEPAFIGADAHPDYLSTRYARDSGRPVVSVQHHYAHVLSCMAEHDLHEEVLGVTWDGTGYGSDGTIWGGEFLAITPDSFHRFGHLRTFRLPGGDRASREPRRSALGLLFELFGERAFERSDLPPLKAFTKSELRHLRKMLEQQINSPLTSSAGRLFDAVAALADLNQVASYEGQAAMELEWAAHGAHETEPAFPLSSDNNDSVAQPGPCPSPRQHPDLDATHRSRPGFTPSGSGNPDPPVVLDWGPSVQAVLDDLRNRLPLELISMRFHNSLVEEIVRMAQFAGHKNIVLSGGCFQNKYLTERAVARLREAGFCPYWHHWVPPNDGGIALGQVMAVRRGIRGEE
jgi:hydrogenase maturation protein HypF